MCLINCCFADMIENPKVRKVLNEVASWRSNVWVWVKNLLPPLRFNTRRWMYPQHTVESNAIPCCNTSNNLERHVEPVVKSFGPSSSTFERVRLGGNFLVPSLGPKTSIKWILTPFQTPAKNHNTYYFDKF